MSYVEKVREYAKNMEFKMAVEKAVEYCIENNILREFLLRQRAEGAPVRRLKYRGVKVPSRQSLANSRYLALEP